MRLNILILISLCAVFGCGKKQPTSPAVGSKSSSPSNASPAIEIQPVASLELAASILRSTTLKCANLRLCPPSVGMLLAADAAGGFAPDSPSVAACTAVLVGENLALTNSHCIPSAVKLLPDLCKDRVRLTFPKTARHPEETIACSELLGASARETPMSPDLALLRLEKKTDRTPLKSNRGGVSNDVILRSFKVNPDLKNLTGLLRSQRCRATARSYRMPVFTGPESSSIVLGDCEAVPGNSGSPLLNSAGELVGLLQAELPISESSEIEWSKRLDDPSGKIARLAMGTSLRCLDADPASGWKWNDTCTTINEIDVASSRPRIRQFLESAEITIPSARLFAPFLTQNPRFKLTPVELETKALFRRETIQPLCLDSPTPGEELSLEFPEILLELRFNRFLQLTTPRTSLLSTRKIIYRVSEDLSILTPIDGANPAHTLNLCQQNPPSGE